MSKFVVVDEIIDQMEATKSGVVPGSVVPTIQSGVETVPTSIIQSRVGGSAGNSYTTLPLYPIVANCCIDKSFVHIRYDMNFKMIIKFADPGADKTVYVPFWFGPDDTALLPNQVQVLLEGKTVYNTTYQREEAVLSKNSLPEIVVRGSERYSTLDKLRQGLRAQPMQRVLVKFSIHSGDTSAEQDVKLHFDQSIDLNTLNPLLSNIHYTTKHFGKLQLKLFFQDIERAMSFCPDGLFATHAPNSIPAATAATDTSAASLTSTNASITAINGALSALLAQQGGTDQFYSFYSFNEHFQTTYDLTSADVGIKSDLIKFPAFVDDGSAFTVTNVVFTNPTSDPFFKVEICEMCQTNFDIKYEEYQRLESFFTSTGSIIIPTQQWMTTPFESSPSAAWLPSYVGIGTGNNINFVGVWCHSGKSPSHFYTLPLTGVQLQLNGQNLNYIPYPYINSRAVADFTQAIIDTDHEEINKDYQDSLSFFNICDDTNYRSTTTGTNLSMHDYYYLNRDKLRTDPHLQNANKFAMYFSTNLPDSFRTGKCVLDDTVNAPNLRLISTRSAPFDEANDATARGKMPLWYDNRNCDSSLLGFSLFCDYCIVLKYDSARGVCYDGLLSAAAPYV